MIVGAGQRQLLVAAPIAVAIVALAPAVELAGCLMGVFCFGSALWLGFRRGRRDLFSPPVLVLAYMGLGIAVKASRYSGAITPMTG